MWCLVLGRRGGGGSTVRESLGAFVTWHFSTPGLVEVVRMVMVVVVARWRVYRVKVNPHRHRQLAGWRKAQGLYHTLPGM